MRDGLVKRGGEREGGKSGASRPVLRTAALLVFAGAVSFALRPPGTASTGSVRSSLRTTPDGVAGLARAVARLGRPVAPRTTPWADADPVRGTVVLLDPRRPPSPREVRGALDRVRGGGVLIYAPRHGHGALADGARTPLMDSLGIRPRPRSPHESLLDLKLAARWGDHSLAEGMPPPRPSRRAMRVEGTDTRRLLVATDSAGEDWLVAAEIRLGHGRVLALADAAPLANAQANDDPLAVLVARAALAWTAPGDTVFFAEYHQGIAGERGQARALLDFLLGSEPGRAFAQLAAVGILALACAGVRFGSPVPLVAPPDRERRSPLEHVSALGALYRKAGAARTAGLLLVARLARALRRSPPRTIAEADALLRRVDAADGARGGPLGGVRAALASDPPDLVSAAAGIDEYLARKSSP